MVDAIRWALDLLPQSKAEAHAAAILGTILVGVVALVIITGLVA